MDNWLECKKWIENQVADYDKVIAQSKKDNPYKVSVIASSTGKNKIISVNLDRQFGFEVELLVISHRSKGVIQARYIAWNSAECRAYVRDLLEPKEFNNHDHN